MIEPLVLAIDQGGQSTRVAVFNATGNQVCCFSSPCATVHSSHAGSGVDFVEQNPLEILRGISDCIEKVAAFLGADIVKIAAAGFAGQGSSLLCWDDETGEPLTPVLSWQDIRGEGYFKNISLSHEEMQAITGLRLSPHYGATKIRWCIDNYPEVGDALKDNRLRAGPIVSFIFRRLFETKQNVVDPGHAQRTLLWNLQTHDWDKQLLDTFCIPKHILPLCTFHNSRFGELRMQHHRIPFTASARDQGASLFASGLPEKAACYINIGTGAFIQRVVEHDRGVERVHVPKGILISPLWISDNIVPHKNNLYAWEATVNGAASALSFLQQQTGTNVTPIEIAKAVALNPTQTCYFLNAVGGLSSPYWRTDLQSVFSDNLSGDEKILAWIESVIFQIFINIQSMDILGDVHKIYISGGLSNIDAICQRIADLTGVKVLRSGNVDATLQGIAYMASGLAEVPSLDDMAAKNVWAPFDQHQIFIPQENPALHVRFKQWQAAVERWLKK